MYNADVISMPDKWEYPWYAAWDLAFHILPLTLVDEEFGKQQLDLILKSQYLHPNGQLPAYEWNFGDVNTPVHAWATIFIYRMEQALLGNGDVEFLKRSFGRLLGVAVVETKVADLMKSERSWSSLAPPLSGFGPRTRSGPRLIKR